MPRLRPAFFKPVGAPAPGPSLQNKDCVSSLNAADAILTSAVHGSGLTIPADFLAIGWGFGRSTRTRTVSCVKFHGCGFDQIHSGRMCRVEKNAWTGIEGLSRVTVSNPFPSQFFQVAVLVNGLTVFVGLRSLNGNGLVANRAQQRWRLRPENARQKRRESEWHRSRPHGDASNFTRSTSQFRRISFMKSGCGKCFSECS